MGLKKYEIITVGSDKRVRALRSWQVGDRYVNIGDVGGIVYDEKTLSQDGTCWLFSGNFGFPGARIGGDSIVDLGEETLPVKGSPAVDILGSSVVVGSKLLFESEQTAADAVVLGAADFKQGAFGTYVVGQPLAPVLAANYIRTKNPIFLGGKSLTVKAVVPGYSVGAVSVDADGLVIATATTVTSGAGVTLMIPAGQYAYIILGKDPVGPVGPADATAAALTFTGTYETKFSIVDSRVEINPATSAGITIIRPGGTYTFASGAKYPEAIIRNSKVSVNVQGITSRDLRLMCQIIGSTAVLDATAGGIATAGLYSNVKNLMISGALSTAVDIRAYNSIQATDCNDFAVSPTVFPGLSAAQTANTPFIFQGCNVPNGIFYHHAQIANTYKNIDFAKAQSDLGKMVAGRPLISSEVEGMYRIYLVSESTFGGLVESYESVRSLNMLGIADSYGTTIYKDAYFYGMFVFAGTNVFGHKVRSHPLAQVLNVQPRAVQGNLTLTVGQRPTLIPGGLARVVINYPIRINTANGITVNNIPAGIQAAFACVDGQGKYVVISTWKEGTATVTNLEQLKLPAAYILFKKADDSNITTEELAGVTMTVYNGCKIVNTGTTAVNMKGNIRVEDNATLVNASITGSGYFGGNSVVYYNPTVWAALDFTGTVYMKDNAVFAPSALTGASALVRMEGNTKFTGSVDVASTNLSFIMRDNAVIEGKANTRSGVVMSGNSRVTASGQITATSRGVLVMEENASIEANTTFIGAITLSGNYKGNAVKTWTGKRTITDVNAPEYDNNVKTQYDF